MKNHLIGGMMQKGDLCSFMVSSIADNGGVAKILHLFAGSNINIEFINRMGNEDGRESVFLCVENKNKDNALVILKELMQDTMESEVITLKNVGILSVFPHREHPVIISSILRILSNAHITIHAIASSISAVSCVVKEEEVPEAIMLLSREFELS